MNIRLKDIIDLDYLISMDDALESKEEITSRAMKDRKIFSQCKAGCKNDTALLLSWLKFRKAEFVQDRDKKGLALLPGTFFSSLYTWVVYAMIFFGSMAGISLAYSFLAYHGTRPINVAVFIALFVVLQVVLILLTLILLARRAAGTKNRENLFHTSIIHTLIAAFFFNVLPKILKKADWPVFKKSLDTLEYTSSLIRTKNREYMPLFFWPFFILTSVFSFGFSTGAFAGTFFRIIVSDMAFGWQSTIMTTSSRVHDMVSFIALPWSWFMPASLAHPSLEQIDGSRIILKDGISVLATQDLISWWPFLCMGIVFYAVIPRAVLMITGIFARNRAVKNFNFERPRFKQVIIRMQSPVVDIDTHKTQVSRAVEPNPIKEMSNALPVATKPETPNHTKDQIKVQIEVQTDQPKPLNHQKPQDQPKPSAQTALILASKTAYTDAAIEKVIQQIKEYLFFDVNKSIGIQFDFNTDTQAVHQVKTGDENQVILVHEVWQPPIRGLLYYIQQIRSAMPENKTLWILLTQDTGQENLCVDDTDINFEIWKQAVFKLENPGIVLKRFM
ncbi:DUF2868 domain-containing protein [Desulfobacula phenolica]|uniref:DUF2868 domain-containing protein n=1 Tax=Desulfobacula phenolica TaxID=90732 RepID=A0A1H2JKF2_9BACT|nr:DUF2868 domain-containing protein [Desulfobacula phenolica]SDU56984.1 Protein of unknown function [Desulfobacula phenolica]